MLCATPYVPPVIKYLFDFLDSQADDHDITDYEVVHTWKCNRYASNRALWLISGLLISCLNFRKRHALLKEQLLQTRLIERTIVTDITDCKNYC